jgi:hypothetical protein
MRLSRLGGVAEELLAHARAGVVPEREEAFADRVSAVVDEVEAVVSESDPLLADELERVVVGAGGVPADLRAAALVGWLRAELAVEALIAQRNETPSDRSRRKQTIGFRFRSPVTREPGAAGGDATTT